MYWVRVKESSQNVLFQYTHTHIYIYNYDTLFYDKTYLLTSPLACEL